MKRMTTKLGAILAGCLMTVSAWGQTPNYHVVTETEILWTTTENLSALDYVKNESTGTDYVEKTTQTVHIDPATDAEFASSTKKDGVVVKNNAQKTLHVYVTGCETISLYLRNTGSSERSCTMEAKPSDGSASVTASTAEIGSTSVALPLSLNANLSYDVKITATNDMMLYAIKFVPSSCTTVEDFAFSGSEISISENEELPTPPVLTNTLGLTVEYASSNPEVVTVDASTGALTKVGVGEAVITATTERQTAGDVVYCSAEASYTVTILSVSPVLESTQENIDLSLAKYENQKTVTFTISGYNLSGEASVTVPEGFTLEPATFEVAEGAVEQEYTLTYVATEAVSETSANLVFTVGETVVTIPVTYGKEMPTALVSVSEATTWDFSKTGETTVQFTDLTSPSKSDTVNLADIFASPDASFNAAAMVMVGEYAVRDGAYNQGGYLKFNVAKPGTVKVEFSNTGNRSTAEEIRYLTVNGTVSTFGAQLSSETVTSDPIAIEAGDVELTGTLAKDQSAQYLRFYKVIYTPNEGDPTGLAENAVLSVYLADNTLFNPENVMLYVYNAAGQMVMSGNADLDMAAQPAGLYIVRSAEGAFKMVK